jgi:glyoxylase-like metal-dependent hydrolase (beta-lactamase superfamily II)
MNIYSYISGTLKTAPRLGTPVTALDACEDVHAVDTHLLGTPGVMSAYVVDAERPAVIDPGAAPAVECLLGALDELGVAPREVAYVIPTHVHLDHAGAAGALARECPEATVLVHERGRGFLVDAERLDHLAASARRAVGDVADAYGDPEVVPPDRCRALADGDVVDLGDRTLTAVDAPGHAPHQVALVDDADDALFAGDAAGMAVGGDLLPTTPPPDFDLEESLATVDRLLALDPSVVCYGHFGARTDARAALETYRGVLPEWVAAVESAVERHGADPGALAAALAGDWPSPTLARDVAGVLRYLDA